VPIIVTPVSTRTLGDLKARIADELARSDLTSQIALAISDAIDEACTHRFWFMEARGLTILALAGTDIYSGTAIGELLEIDRLVLIVGGQRRTLRPMNDDELDRLNDGSAPQGEPYAYSRYGDTLRLYPVPNQNYTVLIDGVTRGATLDSDGDSSIWTTTGEKYVRALAKRDLLGHVIRNPEAAQVQDMFAKRYREELEQQTHSRTATNEMACNG
jgi:hypothetical protein